MALVRPKARILERSTTSGSGPYTLAGAVDSSYNSFASFMAVGDTVYGTVAEPGVAFWAGILTYSATNQITLTTVEESKGTFSTGTKEIFAGQLASKSMFPEDIAGAIVTGGTSTAYTAASYRKYDTLTRLHGNIIAFTPHATNGQTVTLNVDGLGAKPLRPSPGVELQSNSLIQGTPYLALYNHTDQVFYLQAMGGNTYGIPLAAGMDYWAATTPSSAFAFPAGQAISRTTYAALFSLVGTTYGAGDGSTTFNLPDKAERVSVMKAASASRLTTGGGGVDGGTLGAVGGTQTHTLALGQLPTGIMSGATQNITMSYSSKNIALYSTPGTLFVGTSGSSTVAWDQSGVAALTFATSTTTSNTIGVVSNNTSGNAHPNVQPTIVCNYIIRVL